MFNKISDGLIRQTIIEQSPEVQEQQPPQDQITPVAEPIVQASPQYGSSLLAERRFGSYAQEMFLRNQLNAQLQTAKDPTAIATPIEVSQKQNVANVEPQADARLNELQERLRSVRERQKEIRAEITSSKQKALQLQEMAQEIRNSANNDQALSNATLATLGGLGALGLVAGISAPIIGGLFGGLGIFGGLSAADKEKMYKAAAELEKQAGELDLQCEKSNSELCGCDNEAEDIRQRIEEEERKLALGLEDQNFKPSLMTVEGAFQEFQSDGIFIQNDVQSAVPLNPDIQKLTNEE
jgi:DNA repair exonuclease SbcCD ATPase subunit